MFLKNKVLNAVMFIVLLSLQFSSALISRSKSSSQRIRDEICIKLFNGEVFLGAEQFLDCDVPVTNVYGELIAGWDTMRLAFNELNHLFLLKGKKVRGVLN